MAASELYQQLAEAVGWGESKYIPAIFEELADENEAKVLMAASPPATGGARTEGTPKDGALNTGPGPTAGALYGS